MPRYRLPNPSGQGDITVTGNSLSDAEANAAAQNGMSSWTGGSYGADSLLSDNGGGGDGGGGGGDNSGLLGGLDSQLSALMGAISATNEQDFQEKVREFNIGQQNWLQNFNAQYGGTLPGGDLTLPAQIQEAGLTGKFQGQQTQQAQQQAFNQALQASQQTGYLKDPNAPQTAAPGQETLQAGQLTGMFNGAPTEQARQFNINTQTDLAKLASTLSGPGDYFKYLTALNQGRNIVGSLTGGQPTPAFGAPAGNTGGPQSLQNILSGLGIGPPKVPQQMQAGPYPGSTSGNGNGAPSTQAPTAQMAANAQPSEAGSPSGSGSSSGLTIPGFEQFGSLPLPNQINPSNWDSMGPSGQSFMKGAYAAAGYDPNDLMAQINGSRPGTASYGPQTQSAYSGAGGGGASIY